jgi:tRNA nucleotidyltransferase/poly(A) polymerase
MRQKFKAIEFEYIAEDDANTIPFKKIEEIIEMLMPELKKLQKKPEFQSFIEKINTFKDNLENASVMLKELIKCQQILHSLQDVFSVPQISKDLKKEKENFQNIEKKWKKLIERIINDQDCRFNVSKFAGCKSYCLTMLKEYNQKLLDLDKNVKMYLNKQKAKYRLSKDAKRSEIIEKIKNPQANTKSENKPSTAKPLARTSLAQNKSTLATNQTKNVTASKTTLQAQKSTAITKPRTAVPSVTFFALSEIK